MHQYTYTQTNSVYYLPASPASGNCPKVIVEEIPNVKSVQVKDQCATELKRWDISAPLETDKAFTLYGHCGCDKDKADCYVERRMKGLYASQGSCAGTDCSKANDAKWMEAAHAACATALGCAAECQVPPTCLNGSGAHNYYRCQPGGDSGKGACSVRSTSTADAKGVQTACMAMIDARKCEGAGLFCHSIVPYTT